MRLDFVLYSASLIYLAGPSKMLHLDPELLAKMDWMAQERNYLLHSRLVFETTW